MALKELARSTHSIIRAFKRPDFTVTETPLSSFAARASAHSVSSSLDMLQQLPLMSVGTSVYSSRKIRQRRTASCPSDAHPQLPGELMRPWRHPEGWKLIGRMEVLPGANASSSPWAPSADRATHPREMLPRGKDPGGGSPFLPTGAGPNARRENCGTEGRSAKHPESLNEPTLISNLPMPYVQ